MVLTEMMDGSDATLIGEGQSEEQQHGDGPLASLFTAAQPVDRLALSLSLFLSQSLSLAPSAADHSPHGYVVGEAWPPTGGGASQYRLISGLGDPPLDLEVVVGNGDGEEGGEETIVYL